MTAYYKPDDSNYNLQVRLEFVAVIVMRSPISTTSQQQVVAAAAVAGTPCCPSLPSCMCPRLPPPLPPTSPAAAAAPFSLQWHHPVIGSERAWNFTTGSTDVKVRSPAWVQCCSPANPTNQSSSSINNLITFAVPQEPAGALLCAPAAGRASHNSLPSRLINNQAASLVQKCLLVSHTLCAGVCGGQRRASGPP